MKVFLRRPLEKIAISLFLFLLFYIFYYLFFPFRVVISDKPLYENFIQRYLNVIVVKQPFELISDVRINGYPAFHPGDTLLSKLEMQFDTDLRMEVVRSVFCDDGSYVPLVKISKIIPAGYYWGDKAAISDHNEVPPHLVTGVPCYMRFDTDFVIHDKLRRIHYVVQTEKFIAY